MFDEIFVEIIDDDDSFDDVLEGELANEYDDVVDDLSVIEGRDMYLIVIIFIFYMEEGFDYNKRGVKKWSFLKRVIFFKRFFKSLDRKERRKRIDVEENEIIMRLRRELVGERKNVEEWMFDYVFR